MAGSTAFSAGRAISAAAALVAREPLKILLSALLLAGLPDWATTYLSERFALNEQDFMAVFGWTAVSILMMLATNTALQAAVAVIAQDRPRSNTAALVVPVVALSLVTGLGVMAGFVLLIVPGIILSLAWYVAAPAMVAERLGVVAAIKRSNHLTGNARGAIFGLSLAIGLVAMLFGWLTQLVSSAVDNAVFSAIATAAVQTLIGAISASLALSVYEELRHSQEGTADQALEAVFA